MTPYIFQRGETISLALDTVSGDPVSVSGLTARMKTVPPGRTSIPADSPVAADFTVTARAAAGDNPAGWTLTIVAADSALLAPGAYLADARIEVAGGVIVTQSVAIRIRESISA